MKNGNEYRHLHLANLNSWNQLQIDLTKNQRNSYSANSNYNFYNNLLKDFNVRKQIDENTKIWHQLSKTQCFLLIDNLVKSENLDEKNAKEFFKSNILNKKQIFFNNIDINKETNDMWCFYKNMQKEIFNSNKKLYIFSNEKTKIKDEKINQIKNNKKQIERER